MYFCIQLIVIVNMSLKKEDKERKEKMTSNRPSQDIPSTDSADSNQTTKPAEEREVVVERITPLHLKRKKENNQFLLLPKSKKQDNHSKK